MDFQQLIADLNEAGWTQAKIAAQVGCGQPNIARLLKGAGEPRYSIGCALVKLHQEVIDYDAEL